MHLLGQCYEHGYGVEKDAGRAVELYRQAHERRHPGGTCALGLCYELGRGVEMDKARAMELYQEAAGQGDARAQCNLGFFYYQGIVTEEKQRSEKDKLLRNKYMGVWRRGSSQMRSIKREFPAEARV